MRDEYWSGSFWERRYSAEPVLDDSALVGRLRYILAHGVKEGLVERCAQWPGLSCLPQLLGAASRVFRWFNWTRRCRSSAMAALGLGVPLVSNAGAATEPLWQGSGALVLAPQPTAASVCESAEALLANPQSWEALGRRAADFYATHLSLERTLDVLLDRVPALPMRGP